MTVTKANADVLDLTDAYAFTGAVSGAGRVVQVVNTTTTALASGTTTMLRDDTIPQNTEGNEFITQAITPTNSSNKLIIDVSLQVSNGSGTGACLILGALFQDTTAGALAAVQIGAFNSSLNETMEIKHYMTAGTTSETTFKIRVGSTVSGTSALNGVNASRHFGGVSSSSITITEISA
jgi:hypothetical protein